MAPSSRRIVLLLLLFLQASIPIDALAQQPSAGSPGSLHLTLKEEVQLALKQNPQRIIASEAIPCCGSCWWRPRRRRHA